MNLRLRHEVTPEDGSAVRRIVRSTGFFNNAEVTIAVSLLAEYLAKGDLSGYRFVFADQAGVPIAYTCYGPIAGTLSSFDLFWIAVHAEHRGTGVGRHLMAVTAHAIRQLGGTRIYAETSARAQYVPTHRFYAANGFKQQAMLPDFYRPGDGKLIYCLQLTNT